VLSGNQKKVDIVTMLYIAREFDRKSAYKEWFRLHFSSDPETKFYRKEYVFRKIHPEL